MNGFSIACGMRAWRPISIMAHKKQLYWAWFQDHVCMFDAMSPGRMEEFLERYRPRVKNIFRLLALWMDDETRAMYHAAKTVSAARFVDVIRSQGRRNGCESQSRSG